MGMWEADDLSARWIHGICAIPVLAFLVLDLWLLLDGTDIDLLSTRTGAEGASSLGAAYFAYRLLWYAFTGRNCLNREDYNR